jgi:two-component system sensor histidine kinase CpxA
MPFAREAFDIDEVIEEVVRDANFEGAVKGCQVRLSGAAKAAVHGNRELLRSAIENVLRNAVRYSPSEMPVAVAVERTEAGLVISIRDRGPGVPVSDLERIFEPFYRVAESRDGGSATASNSAGGGFEVALSLPRAALSA